MLSQRTVRGVIQRLKDSESRAIPDVFSGEYPVAWEAFDTFRLVPFAVGELPMLSIGTVFRRGRAYLPRRGLQVRTFTLDFNTQGCFRLGDVPPPLPFDRLVAKGAEPVLRHSSLTALPLNGDPYGVCIPVVELLRWCYGSSSRMLQAVLSDELDRVLRWVDEHAGRQGDLLHLNLPQGFLPQDSYTLAWLSQDVQARLRALGIDRSVSVTRGRDERSPGLSHPSALFPYTGIRQIKVRGRWIPVPHQKPRFLVHQVLNVAFALPFTVTLPVPQLVDQEGTPVGQQSSRLPPARGQNSILTSEQEPRRAGKARLLTALPSQFSEAALLSREEGSS